MAKKIKIPKKVLIGGITYDVKFVKRFREELGDPWGFCNGRKSTIELLKINYDGQKFSDATLLGTFLHELLHSIDYVYCDTVSEERVIIRLTEIVYQLLSDNDFYIGEDKFPKFIRIFGTKFKVVTNYDFGNDLGTFNNLDSSACVSSCPCLIKIVSKKHTSSIDVITSHVLEVCMQYSVNTFFKEEEEAKINVSRFAAGLYQVLKSTKLDKMIRECNK